MEFHIPFVLYFDRAFGSSAFRIVSILSVLCLIFTLSIYVTVEFSIKMLNIEKGNGRETYMHTLPTPSSRLTSLVRVHF